MSYLISDNDICIKVWMMMRKYHMYVCVRVFFLYIYMLYDIYNIRDLKLMLTICPHIFQRFKS